MPSCMTQDTTTRLNCFSLPNRMLHPYYVLEWSWPCTSPLNWAHKLFWKRANGMVWVMPRVQTANQELVMFKTSLQPYFLCCLAWTSKCSSRRCAGNILEKINPISALQQIDSSAKYSQTGNIIKSLWKFVISLNCRCSVQVMPPSHHIEKDKGDQMDRILQIVFLKVRKANKKGVILLIYIFLLI